MALDASTVVVMSGRWHDDYTNGSGFGPNSGPTLGYPTSEPQPAGRAVVVRLSGGEAGPGLMASDPTGRMRWLRLPVAYRWLELNGPEGPLGRPTSNQYPAFDGRDTIQDFEHGRVRYDEHQETATVEGASTRFNAPTLAILTDLYAALRDDEREPRTEGPKRMTAPGPISKVFMSYVRDDAATVDRLAAALKSRGIKVWLDRDDLPAGVRWKTAIKDAIQNGGGVVACFSTNYQSRHKTYMNEELTLIIEEIRARPTDRSWFVPVRLDPCEIPDRPIGAGETLRDIQQVDLFDDWLEGIRRIAQAFK